MSFSNVTCGGPPLAPVDFERSKRAYINPAAITDILFARIFIPSLFQLNPT
jgi:hypothetical protein